MIIVRGLHKSYQGKFAVKDLNFEVPKGKVLGLLGPNGSGKSTTLGCILGTVLPDAGQILWGNEPMDYAHRMKTGALLESPVFYPNLSARNNLKILATLKSIEAKEIDRALELTGLTGVGKKPFAQYSTGMKQRLGLAATLLGKPGLLILDEPTNGLDPEGIADVRNIIQGIAKEGKTIVLASHMLDEVQKLCDYVVVLKQGVKRFEGEVSGLMQPEKGIIIGAEDMEALKSALSTYTGVESMQAEGNYIVVILKADYKLSELSTYLVTQGIDISHISARQGNLEQKILDILKS
jgi:ABC-type multidrug transport system ATPase subunit